MILHLFCLLGSFKIWLEQLWRHIAIYVEDVTWKHMVHGWWSIIEDNADGGHLLRPYLTWLWAHMVSAISCYSSRFYYYSAWKNNNEGIEFDKFWLPKNALIVVFVFSFCSLQRSRVWLYRFNSFFSLGSSWKILKTIWWVSPYIRMPSLKLQNQMQLCKEWIQNQYVWTNLHAQNFKPVKKFKLLMRAHVT